MSTKVLADLNPPLVWKLFEAISRIPRCSKKEHKICAWIESWAKRRNIPCTSDAAGNILLRRTASPGRAQVPILVLQAHLDMVCVQAEGLQFDFDNDPIPIRMDGSRVRAEGTTLGADNGIGVAYCLAALNDPELVCGPLEVLLTVDEEEGATGALGLKSGFFSGRYLLNLDSEETGIVTIGTAGFEATEYKLPVHSRRATGYSAVSLSIRGLAGGHSGLDIHLPRMNAIKVAIEALSLLRKEMPIRLTRFDGGEAENSIPAQAECILQVPGESEDRALALLGGWRRDTLVRARGNEPGLEITIGRVSSAKACTEKAYIIEETETICRILTEIPHGPLAFSGEIEGLVVSSSNLARLQSKADSIEITVSCRSSLDEVLAELSSRLRRIGKSRGAQVKQRNRIPGWTAKPASALNKLVQKHYSSTLGRPVTLKAFHAGLECGIFTGLNPELQMASIGPDIHAAHTAEEHVDIPSVLLLWEALRRIIAGMAELSETGDEDEQASG